MPRVPVNDFVIHPRDNDLVLATHGRGVWILDDITPLQQLTPEVLAEAAHLFPIRPAAEIRMFNPRAHQGDMVFFGANPPGGAIVDYYLRAARGSEAAAAGPEDGLTVVDATGRQIAKLEATHNAGLNRVVWHLRYDALPPGAADEESGGRATPIPGPFVMPGEYTVRLTAGGSTLEQKVEVREDPRIEIAPADRKMWTETLLAIADVYRAAVRSATATKDPVARELASRAGTLYRAVSESTGKPTMDQQAQLQFYRSELDKLKR
jgi:hypothetical protein